jgi:hypothetical protein
MITSWHEGLKTALNRPEPHLFARDLVDLYHSVDSMTGFAAHTGAHLAKTLYRTDYHRNVPQSYLGFAGAVELGRFMQPLHHLRAVAQALWFYSKEYSEEPYPIEYKPEGLELTPGQRAGRMEQAWREREFQTFLNLSVAGLSHLDTRESTAEWLFGQALGDLNAHGHKLHLLSRSIALLDYLRWEQPEVYLFPALHYFFYAAEDRSAEQLVQARLAHHGLELYDRAASVFELSAEQTKQIRDSLFFEPLEDVLDTLLGALKYGVEPAELMEALQVSAAHLVLSVPYSRWIFPVQGFNTASATLRAMEFLDAAQQQRAVLISGVLLKRLVESSSPFRLEEPFVIPRPEEAQPRPGELEEAIDLSISSDAMAVADWLYQHSQLSPRVMEDLSIAAAKTDGDLHNGHDLKFVQSALDAFETSTSPLRESYLLAVCKFLGESEKSRELDHALVQAQRFAAL